MAASFTAGGTPDPNPGNPGGTGDNGETWDPNSKRWIPKGQPGSPAPRAADGAGGYSNASNQNYGDNSGERKSHFDGDNTIGKARSPGAWGGYNGRYVDDGNGGTKFDGTHSGRQDAVDHLQGLAGAAMNQQAYKNDYSQADRFAGAGQQDRGFQTDAMDIARRTAFGTFSPATDLGRKTLVSGVDAQKALAASTRGGSLAQASAMRQQAEAQGAFVQQGNNDIDAAHANEMAAARKQYFDNATGLRASDATAQGLNQSQTMSQMDNELKNRQRQDRGQQGYDDLAQDTNIGAANASLGQHEQNAGVEDKSMQRHQNKLDQGVGWVGDGVSTAGSLGSGASGFSGGGPPGAGAKPPDPYSQQVSASDSRAKTGIRSLATAVMARRGMR